MPLIEQIVVSSANVQLAVQVCGPESAPPIVLVHGYPDNHEVWDGVRDLLCRDFRVVTYDCRGAGASSAPRDRAAYRMEHFVDDLAAVAGAVLPGRRFHLVGHDWGSVHSWESVTSPRMSGRIASFTSISGPNLDYTAIWMKTPPPQGPTLRARLGQVLASWYIGFFHLPVLPELLWRLGGTRLWPWWLRLTEGLTHVQPGPTLVRDAVNGLAMYRANFLPRARRPQPRPPHAPVQLLVAMRDRYVGPAVAESLAVCVPQYRKRELPGATHWVLRAQPQRVASCIAEFVDEIERDASTQAAGSARRGA